MGAGSPVDHIVLDWLTLQSISRRLDLVDGSEPKDFHVGRPEELFIVSGVDQPVLDLPDRALHVADKLAAVARLQLADLRLVVEHRILKDLLDVLIADLGRVLARRPQMLPTVHREIDLRVSKVFRLVVREQENGAVSHTSSHLSPIPALLFTAYNTFVEIDARYNFFAYRDAVFLFQSVGYAWNIRKCGSASGIFATLQGRTTVDTLHVLLVELLYLHLIFVCLIRVWWEGHLCLVELIEHH